MIAPRLEALQVLSAEDEGNIKTLIELPMGELRSMLGQLRENCASQFRPQSDKRKQHTGTFTASEILDRSSGWVPRSQGLHQLQWRYEESLNGNFYGPSSTEIQNQKRQMYGSFE